MQMHAQDLSWAAGKKYMGNVDAFLRSLLTFNKDAIPVPCVDKCEKDYISNPAFNADNIRTKSGAAAGLCAWVINICKYFRIYQVSSCLSVNCEVTAGMQVNLIPLPPCNNCRWSRPSARPWRRPTGS